MRWANVQDQTQSIRQGQVRLGLFEYSSILFEIGEVEEASRRKVQKYLFGAWAPQDLQPQWIQFIAGVHYGKTCG